MPRKSPPKPDEKPQLERFLEAAKEHGAAETDAGLTDAIRKIATVKPKEDHPRPSGKKASS
jgi:hypothetical protein